MDQETIGGQWGSMLQISFKGPLHQLVLSLAPLIWSGKLVGFRVCFQKRRGHHPRAYYSIFFHTILYSRLCHTTLHYTILYHTGQLILELLVGGFSSCRIRVHPEVSTSTQEKPQGSMSPCRKYLDPEGLRSAIYTMSRIGGSTFRIFKGLWVPIYVLKGPSIRCVGTWKLWERHLMRV